MKKRLVTYKRREAIQGYLFILPWILGALLFFAVPLGESLLFSVSTVTNTGTGFDVAVNSPGGNGRGFWDNYRYMLFMDADFLRQLTTTAGDTLAAVVVITLFSLFVAAMLHGSFKGRNIYRSVFFLPVIMTTGVTYLMIQVGLSGGETLTSTSAIDAGNAFTFKVTSLRDIMLQGGVSPGFVESVTRVVNMIFGYVSKSGVQILLFLSGFAKIPVSHYEAAKIEGANSWEAVWKITFPVISPVIFLNIVYTMLDSFITYGTEDFGNVTMYAIQRMGFGSTMRFEYASAMSWIYTAMIALFLLAVYLLVGKPSAKINE
jgi:ABC-type sugar transport system permease subunit